MQTLVHLLLVREVSGQNLSRKPDHAGWFFIVFLSTSRKILQIGHELLVPDILPLYFIWQYRLSVVKTASLNKPWCLM
jgi:hypothetical protein